MKKLVFILAFTLSTFSFAMQDGQKNARKWPSDLPNLWIFETKLKEEFSPDLVAAEIKEKYKGPHDRVDFFGTNGIHCMLEDTKENIMQNFNDKPWFLGLKLRRPLIGSPAS